MTRGSIEAINTSERIPLRLNASPRKRSLSPPKQISAQSIRLTPAPIAASTLRNASSLSVGRRSSRPPVQPLKLSIPIFQAAYIPFPNFPSYLIVIQCDFREISLEKKYVGKNYAVKNEGKCVAGPNLLKILDQLITDFLHLSWDIQP